MSNTKLKQPINPKSPHVHVVYKHTSLTTGKSYIGITKNYAKRSNQHQHNDKCAIFHRAINKYGWNDFTHEFLAVDLSKQAALHFEEFYIRTHNTRYPYGYNLEAGGVGSGKRHPISLAKSSESQKGKKQSPETIAKRVAKNLGMVITPEHRAKISKANTGRKLSPEHIAKFIATRTGKPNSEESHLRRAEKTRLRKESESKRVFYRVKRIKPQRHSEETRAKMSAANKGRSKSESHKSKIGFAGKKNQFKKEYEKYLENIVNLPTDVIFTSKELNLHLGNREDNVIVNRRIVKGEFPNAYKGKYHTNLIPITDVIAYYEKYKEIYLVDSDVELL